MEFRLRNNLLSRYYQMNFGEKELIVQYPKRKLIIPYLDIDAFRFGIRWIKGYASVIGRIYTIEVKYLEDCVLPIKLTNFYKKNLEVRQNIYTDIVNTALENIFNKRIIADIERMDDGATVTADKFQANKDGFFLKRNQQIAWQDTSMKKYETYFAIYDSQNPDNHLSFYYLHDWNAWCIYNICKNFISVENIN